MESKSGDFSRYQRQMLLPQIGAAGQAMLAGSRVLLVGCGALGSSIAELLARAGVGFLRIVDRDLVELTNLQRQTLFDESDAAGELPKAIAAFNRLRKINSGVVIEPIVADANAGNIESLAGLEAGDARVDLVLDGTDNVSTRYLVNDLCVKNSIPWVYGACVGTVGRVMGIWPGRTACLRCLFPQPPRAEELATCDTAGVLGPAAVIVAGFQAAVGMQMLLADARRSRRSESGADHSNPVSDSPDNAWDRPDNASDDSSNSNQSPLDFAGLLSLDVWTGDSRLLPSARHPQPDCPCCGSREFPFLSTGSDDFTTTLCGRQAVQVRPAAKLAKIDLDRAADRLSSVGEIARSPFFVRCRLIDPPGIQLTLFPDGRLMVQGTTDPLRARSIYARFVGN